MTGNVNAGRVTGSMFKTFSSIRMAVLVGIGGGVPRAQPSDDPTENVHLGDVVVGWPGDGGPACIYYDSGRWHTDGEFEVLGTINRPDQVLLNALGKLVSDHEMDRSTFDVHRKRLLQSKHNRKFTFPGLQRDQLFNASYQHAGILKNKCASCDSSQLVQRPERTEEEATGFIFHRGRIATGNAVVKDGERRDQIRDQCNGALCIEMEAAGVDAGRPCLVIRGISDYADSHKGDVWRSYAAGNAAVFARELLSKIPPSSVRNLAIEGYRNDAKPWLFIIDNVDDLQLLTDGRLTSHLPFSRKGSILFTTRNRQVTAHLQAREGVFDLVQLNNDESRQLLHQGLQTSQIGDEKSTNKLLEYLVRLPLAIRQASAYMQLNMYMTIAKYLEICKASNQNMIAMLSRDFGEQDRYEKTANAIATTWLISFEQITRDAPLAASYLRNIAYFAEKDIPISLLPDGREDWDKVEAVSVLKGYAFILDRGTVDRFDIHRLVHVAMRNWIQTQGDQGEQVTEVVCQVSEMFPWPTHENRDVWTSYLPHAQTVLEFRGYCMEKEMLGLLQHNVAEVYNFLGQYEEAEQMHRKTLALYGKVLGPENPSTLTSMNNLASVLGSQGKYEEAEQMHRKILALREKVLGPENPLTFDSMNNLASVLDNQGKYEEAEQMHRKTLALREKVLGPENPSTFDSMNNLALVFDNQGKYEEAEQMHRKTLALREKVLGPENPLTFDSMNNLASVLKNQRKYEEAEHLYQRLNLLGGDN
ncbi:kinesin light chain [Pyricularia oryzae]|nr:kinesin light chain [Pyricularia oryzae]